MSNTPALTPVEEVLPEKFGIEQKQASELMGSLPIVKQQREPLIERYKEVIKLDIESPETAKLASELRKEIVKNRTQGIEKWHKESKDIFLRGGQFVDAIKRSESSVNTTMEAELEAIEKHQERKEQARKEAIRLERVGLLSEFDGMEIPGLGEMSDSQFEIYLTGVKSQFEAKQQAEKERIEAERVQNLHNERYARLAKYADFIPDFENLNFGKINEEDFIKIGTDAKAKKDKADADQARIKAENERLQKERDDAERKAKEEADKAEKARKEAEEKARKEADKIKAEADAKLKAEQEARAKVEAEALRKQKEAEAEAERLRQAEQARIDAEAKAEADRIAEQERIAQQGENERLLAWIESFELPNLPGGKYNKKSNATISDVSAKFESFKSWAKTQIK